MVVRGIESSTSLQGPQSVGERARRRLGLGRADHNRGNVYIGFEAPAAALELDYESLPLTLSGLIISCQVLRTIH